MSSPADPTASVAPPLSATLGRLAALGVRVPAGVSHPQALESLVRAGLVPARPVREFLELYERQRFAAGSVNDAQARAAAQGLVRALETLPAHDPSLVDATLATLAAAAPRPPDASSPITTAAADAPSPGPVGGRSAPLGSSGAAASVPDPVVAVAVPGPPAVREVPPADAPADAPVPAYLRTFQLPRRWWLWSGLFLVWSLGLLYAGLRLALPFRDLVRPRISVARGLAPAHNSLRERLDALRVAAGRQPTVARPWWEYADFAHRAHEWGDAVLAYRHLMALQPDDPEALNSLAWLYCRAEDPWARDPAQALALAERAHALKPAPHITDTLAEAVFLTGDLPRALQLAEDALARAEHRRRYYRKQRDRFRSALQGAAGATKGEAAADAGLGGPAAPPGTGASDAGPSSPTPADVGKGTGAPQPAPARRPE